MQLSYSHLKTHRTCERKWWLRYPEGWRLKEEEPEGPRPVYVGRLFHAILENYYADVSYNPHEAFDNLALAYVDDPDQQKKLKKVTDMWSAYIAEYGTDRDTIGIMDTEVHLEVPNGRRVFGDKFPSMCGMLGYVDGLATMDHGGDKYIVEHKTTTRTVSSWIADELPALRLQTGIYSLMYAHLHHCMPPPVMFNVVRQFVGPRAERPVVWRHWLTFTDSMLEGVKWNVAQMAQGAINSYENMEPPPPPTYGIQCSSCDYAVVCSSFDEGEYPTELMNEFYVRTELRP